MEKQKIQSIEFGRVIAILAITAMHAKLFLTYWKIDDTAWIGLIFNQATRFAVPLFFLISGYLIQPKLENNPIETVKNYSLPLCRIYLVWSLICLVMPFNLAIVAEHGYLVERQGYWYHLAKTPLNSLLEGGLVHLWFIPALIIAASIGALLSKFKQLKLFIPLGIGLYLFGTLAGSYQGLTEISAPFFTRNGPFFSTLFFALGVSIRQKDFKLTSNKAMLIALVGMCIYFLEAMFLHQHGQAFNMNDYLFASTLWATGCFLWLLAKPNFGKNAWLTRQSPYVLPFYVAHMPMIILMMNVAGILGLSGFAKDMLIFFGAILLSFGLIKGLEKTRLYSWIFR